VELSAFFTTEPDDGWGGSRTILNTGLVDAISNEPIDVADDLDVAHALAQLVYEELRKYGTDGTNTLSDNEIASTVKALRSVLRRLDIDFAPPFRDFTTFHDYWSRGGMSGAGGWAARRGYLSELFEPIWAALDDAEVASTSDAMRGVDGELKNIIFASSGPKPEIVLRDAVNNIVEIVAYEESCLVYDRPLTDSGLTWGEIVTWWGEGNGESTTQLPNVDTARDLYARLETSLADNVPEKLLFRTYCERYGAASGYLVPALLPQVYLHFDPLTKKQRAALGIPERLDRERMDFLLLLPGHIRIVIEVDGKQHYADDDTASPRLYSEMVAEDRALRIRGYEVYRFGGYELAQPGAADRLREFFDQLLQTHGIID
jgi:hypothetical protein